MELNENENQKLRDPTFRAIVEDPGFLPLSGGPRLAALGTEVRLGSGPCDILAIELTGRPVIIEAKLVQNSEARREAAAQVLDYAACLHGVAADAFEEIIVRPKLLERGLGSLTDAVEQANAEAGLDHHRFYANLESHLADGSFRLVLLLDEHASWPLLKIAKYLDHLSELITIDVVKVTQESGGLLRAQRIDHEHAPNWRPIGPTSELTDGSSRFEAELEEEPDSELVTCTKKFIKWAYTLQEKGYCIVQEGPRSDRMRLYLVHPYDGTVPVYVYPESGTRHLWIEKSLPPRAPQAARQIAEIIGKDTGKVQMAKFPELKDAIEAAYREAAGV